MNMLYKQLLLFPERAENLGQFSAYDVDLEHWKGLSAVFRQTFQAVYERGASAILLVHGGQGTGKTLFSRRLEQDFKKATEGSLTPDKKNLWHNLVGDDPPTRATIETATQGSVLHRIEPTSGWLAAQREQAKLLARLRVRIFVLDDAHKDVFLREWASLTQAEYLGFKARQEENVALASVAERLVEDCRGDFQRSIFLLLSNDATRMAALKEHVDRSHRGLAKVLELPLPAPEMKEQIVRKNTNRLNRMSYWYCLDAAGKDERRSVYDVLQSNQGFTNSFAAVSEALQSADVKRAGRPANRSLITLVTLGTPPSAAKGFLDDHELAAQEHHRGEHVGVWLMREQWASMLYEGDDREASRRAQMLESEFSLRWVALDMRATFLLCQPPSPADLGERVLDIVRFVPSIAKPGEVKKHGEDCAKLEIELSSGGGLNADEAAFGRTFLELGQRRSSLYEPAIGRRLSSYSRGFAAFPSVKPDFIAGEYKPCAVTTAPSRNDADITDAIRRACHAIEFTAHLRDDMVGLKEYLLDKVGRYALLLESI
jgi:hypothetical protein